MLRTARLLLVFQGCLVNIIIGCLVRGCPVSLFSKPANIVINIIIIINISKELPLLEKLSLALPCHTVLCKAARHRDAFESLADIVINNIIICESISSFASLPSPRVPRRRSGFYWTGQREQL